MTALACSGGAPVSTPKQRAAPTTTARGAPPPSVRAAGSPFELVAAPATLAPHGDEPAVIVPSESSLCALGRFRDGRIERFDVPNEGGMCGCGEPFGCYPRALWLPIECKFAIHLLRWGPDGWHEERGAYEQVLDVTSWTEGRVLGLTGDWLHVRMTLLAGPPAPLPRPEPGRAPCATRLQANPGAHIAALATGEVYVAGTECAGKAGSSGIALVERFTHAEHDIQALPMPPTGGPVYPFGIVARSPKDVAVFGVAGSSAPWAGYLARYDGSRWALVAGAPAARAGMMEADGTIWLTAGGWPSGPFGELWRLAAGGAWRRLCLPRDDEGRQLVGKRLLRFDDAIWVGGEYQGPTTTDRTAVFRVSIAAATEASHAPEGGASPCTATRVQTAR